LNSPNCAKKSKELVKERIRTQISNQLSKNHMEYINSAERELIIGRKLGPGKIINKESLTTSTRPFKDKLHVM
jgi:hypothetical protein